MVVDKIGAVFEELSFQHYLRNMTQESQELQKYNRAGVLW